MRRQAEDAAVEPWRAAVWVPEQRLVMLLLEGGCEFQVVELLADDDDEEHNGFHILREATGRRR